jgi:hypothetical protein
LSIRHAKRQSQANTRSLHTYGFQPPPAPTPLADTQYPVNPNTVIPSTIPCPTPRPSTNTPDCPTAQTPQLHQRLITWARIRIPTPPSTSLPPHNSPDPTSTSEQSALSTPTEATNPHTIRAPHHKHSRWRSIEVQRQRFLSFFRR